MSLCISLNKLFANQLVPLESSGDIRLALNTLGFVSLKRQLNTEQDRKKNPRFEDVFN